MNLKYKDFNQVHPAAIVKSISKFLWILFIPLLRSLTISFDGFYYWIKGAWLDILVILVVLLLGYLSWSLQKYLQTSKGIYFLKGIISRKLLFIPYDKITCVSIEVPFYLKPFKAVKFKLNTNGGGYKKADIFMILFKNQAEKFYENCRVSYIKNNKINFIYKSSWIQIIMLSFISSNTIAGVIFVFTLITKSGNILGDKFKTDFFETLTKFAELLAFGLPPFAAILGYIVLFGWLISFIINVLENITFNVKRQNNEINIENGFFVKKQYTVISDKINFIQIKQSLVTKMLGFYITFIHCTGYGKSKNQKSVIIPSDYKNATKILLNKLLPEIKMCDKKYFPQKNTLPRFIFMPITFVFISISLTLLCFFIFEKLKDLSLFLGIMLIIPFIWYLIVRIISYKHTGIGKKNQTYTLKYTYGFGLFTDIIPEKNIVKIIFRQSLFQKPTKSCDIIIYTQAEGIQRHLVPNILKSQAIEIINNHKFS